MVFIRGCWKRFKSRSTIGNDKTCACHISLYTIKFQVVLQVISQVVITIHLKVIKYCSNFQQNLQSCNFYFVVNTLMCILFAYELICWILKPSLNSIFFWSFGKLHTKMSILVIFILIDENSNPLVKMLQHENHGETTLMDQSLTISQRDSLC